MEPKSNGSMVTVPGSCTVSRTNVYKVWHCHLLYLGHWPPMPDIQRSTRYPGFRPVPTSPHGTLQESSSEPKYRGFVPVKRMQMLTCLEDTNASEYHVLGYLRALDNPISSS